MNSYTNLFQQLLHNGIAEKRNTIQQINEFRGAIFAVRKKDNFTEQGVKGYIISTLETLMEHAEKITHFTPNVYRKFAYTDSSRTFITGFEEKNLHQVNTFVVDIDTKAHSIQHMLLTCIDEGFGPPTCIVESARGYQLYFMLQSPFFMSKNNNYRTLKIAKRISNNLKRALHSIDADLYCNDFGFFRVPNKHNIVYLQLEQTYTVHELIQWSMRQEHANEPFYPRPVNAGHKLTQSDWFNALIRAIHIKGKKGVLGRNNALFTLALACFADGWDYERTYNLLDELNSAYTYPLSHNEVETLLGSAYSGKYNGPAKQYVEILIEQYVPNFTGKISVCPNVWYKFKKDRTERVRSHYDEIEQDLIKFIQSAHTSSEAFIWLTQNELCAKTGISQSSLNELLKKTSAIVKVVKGKGRGAKTGWTTVALFMKHIARTNALNKATYMIHILALLQTAPNFATAHITERLNEVQNRIAQPLLNTS